MTDVVRPPAAVPEAVSPPALEGLARLDLIRGSFAAAARAGGQRLEQAYEIAGAHVRLWFASPQMMWRLSKAFGHLPPIATSSSNPELTVHLWDSASAGTAAPPVPKTDGEEAPGAFFYYTDDRVRFGYQRGTSGDPRVLAVYPHAPTPALSVLDSEHGEAWYWVADAARIPYWEQATPMVHLFDWWLRARGLHLVHAGAAGTRTGGVLLVGKSGSGKSTATLSTLQSQLQYAGDDYVAVSLGPRPWVHSLYSSGKLMPDHVMRLPFLLPKLANAEHLDVEKAVVYVHEQWPSNSTAGFPLRAILVPRVVPDLVEARIFEASRFEALTAVAPSTVFQMHTRARDSLARTRLLVEAVPSYVLEFGSDMAAVPRAISNLLERLEGER